MRWLVVVALPGKPTIAKPHEPLVVIGWWGHYEVINLIPVVVPSGSSSFVTYHTSLANPIHMKRLKNCSPHRDLIKCQSYGPWLTTSNIIRDNSLWKEVNMRSLLFSSCMLWLSMQGKNSADQVSAILYRIFICCSSTVFNNFSRPLTKYHPIFSQVCYSLLWRQSDLQGLC